MRLTPEYVYTAWKENTQTYLSRWVCKHPPPTPPPQQTQQEIWFQTQNLATLLRYFSFPQPSDKMTCGEVGEANSATTEESGGILLLHSGLFHSHCSVIPLHIISLKRSALKYLPESAGLPFAFSPSCRHQYLHEIHYEKQNKQKTQKNNWLKRVFLSNGERLQQKPLPGSCY